MKIVILIMGALLMEGISWLFGIGDVANHVQVLSAAPVFWLLYRVEKLHQLHKKSSQRE